MPSDRIDGLAYDPDLGHKFIFVTGGVMSGLGKGITAASTGRILKEAGYDVTAVKIDPYLNVDAGTMNPFEHGEVYVMKDGGEVDLDLGNYERFLDTDMTSGHNITTGTVYQDVIEQERAGDFLGNTVQIIPHITTTIKKQIREAAAGHDICLVELGGTIGDIEGMPFLEAVRQFRHEEPDDHTALMHVTLVPYAQTGEQKTKPTQHSVKELRSLGLHPDVIVGRCTDRLQDATKTKIARFCDVPTDAVFSNWDTDDIYRVPRHLADAGLHDYLGTVLSLDDIPAGTESDDALMADWEAVTGQSPDDSVTIALVGKYGMGDAYLSVTEALKHAGFATGTDVTVEFVHSETYPEGDAGATVANADGVIVPGGFGERGIPGKLAAIEYARTHETPFLGLCLGFQLAVVEYARHVCGLADAHSTEFDADTPDPVIDLLPEQYDVEDLGGTMRLGTHETTIVPETLAAELYDATTCRERHRHRYEVNPEYRDQLEAGALTFSGYTNNRMEILELAAHDHPYFIGTQFHPEFRSRPTRPSPPFVGLVAAAQATATADDTTAAGDTDTDTPAVADAQPDAMRQQPDGGV